jgi:SprT protein
LVQWLIEEKVKLRITKPRKSKLGDYRAPHQGKGHQISVNVNLNKYSFLITLVHEFAHLYTWKKYKHRAKAHGIEWKQTYIELMDEVHKVLELPLDIRQALHRYMQNPAASSCTDVHLQLVLKKYDVQPEGKTSLIYVQQLPDQAFFSFRGKQYQRLEQIRKRIKCIRLENKKMYLFSPLAEVEPVQD